MRIELSKAAFKVLQKLEAKQRERIMKALAALPAGDIKPMEGKPEGRYRLRIGGYRAIYRIDSGVAYIVDIGARGDIYK